jgi:hypothetical protein
MESESTRKRPVMRERRAELVMPGESFFLERRREIRMPAVPKNLESEEDVAG